MKTMWLKRIDVVSRIIPGSLLRFGENYSSLFPVCVVRPGGMGDLVAITRAVLDLHVNPRDIFWIGEKRNQMWAEYLRLPFASYSDPKELMRFIRGASQFEHVVNSEQYHGLASIFSCRVAGKRGRISGLSCNPRADLCDQVIEYDPVGMHQVDGFKSLLATAPLPIQKAVFSLPEAKNIVSTSYAVVGLGGLTCSYRKLSLEKWSELIDIAAEFSKEIYLVGAPDERSFADELNKISRHSIQNKVGSIPFTECLDLIRGSKRFVGIDSGLLNVADFFNIPATAVFVKWKVKQWGPKHPQSVILDHDNFVRKEQARNK